jgi:1-acyl-sn-glycerol-3-phosphate acyltransferase
MHQLLVWWFFTVKGWRIKGEFPFYLKKAIYIVAPHTHSSDFFLGLAIRKKMHFEFLRFLGKKELFIPPFSWVLHSLGCSPVDRSTNNNLVDQVVQKFNENESFHLALSPEGTRKKVNKLKSGFYHIAKKANVPVVMVGLDFFKREVVFAEPFMLSDDEHADKRKIIDFFKDFKGYIPEYGITADIEC